MMYYLLLLYLSEIILGATITITLSRQLRHQQRRGTISLFIVHLYVFFLFHTFHNIMHVATIVDGETSLTLLLWAAGHTGMIVSFFAITVQIVKRKFDMFIITKEEDKDV